MTVQMKFTGTEDYVATDDSMVAVNAAITLERPLLVKGEPGTGKTDARRGDRRARSAAADRMAHQVDHQGAAGPLRIRRGLAPARLPARRRAGAATSRNYIVKGKLWEAFDGDEQPVLLIDEIDKADIEFPNDLLHELDRMEFYVYETRRDDQGASSARSSSSPPTTRRSCPTRSCAAASSTTSASPTPRRWSASSTCTIPDIKKRPGARGADVFFEIRDVPGLKKKPSTSELLDWLKLLLAEDIPPERCASATRRS